MQGRTQSCSQRAVAFLLSGQADIHLERRDNLRFLVIYNPPSEDYVCVEPTTHMPDAINRAALGQSVTGFAVLPAHDTAAAVHRFSYRPAPRSPQPQPSLRPQPPDCGKVCANGQHLGGIESVWNCVMKNETAEEISALDNLQAAHRVAVAEWIMATKKEEALAS